MAPIAEISQLIARAVIDNNFKNKLMDPESRNEALESARTGSKKIEGIPLTDEEIAALEKIEPTDLPGFASVCSNYQKLMGQE